MSGINIAKKRKFQQIIANFRKMHGNSSKIRQTHSLNSIPRNDC